MARTLDKRVEVVRANLVRFREEIGLSQALAAYFSDIPIHTLRRYEQGRNRIGGMELIQLMELYGRPLGDIKLENPPPRRPEDWPPVVYKLDADLDSDLRHEFLAAVEKIRRQHIERRSKKTQPKPRIKD